ncbi:MAG: SpoIIE family protein phosphatase [Planctomycetales bacterium]|nr:SpoIIE family protein phosphatase [Planctomycetales bacterium]
MAYLVANNGPRQGARYELDSKEHVLGRHPDCQIVVDVGAVSRQHARIVPDGDEFALEDLESRNGTYLNGQPIKARLRHQLNHGDRVRICDIDFTFISGSDRVDMPFPSSQDGSSFRTVLVEDEAESGSTIMSKLDVSNLSGRLQLSATPQAKLAAMMEIARSLGGAVSLDAVLPQVLASMFKIFVQADRGFIVLKMPDGSLVPRWTQTRREDDADTIRISRTIVNEVMREKEAILSADAATDTRFEMSQSIADFRIRSMMCAPLIDSQGNAIGALQIDTLDQRKRFAQEDLEVLASIAAQAAVAIENAQLHDQLLRQREIERDLQLAHDVQKAFLPTQRPGIPGYDFYDYYNPANHIGGDYFDYIALPDGRTAIIVADVVGHGVAAAMFMAKLSAEARFQLASEADPAKAITQLNTRLAELNVERFVTMVMVVLDPKTHQATIVNAGHMAPLHRSAKGEIDEPGADQSGLPLAILDDVEYEPTTITLEAGDILVMYTDGVNEAMNNASECYGIERLRDLVQRGAESLTELGESSIADVRAWIGNGVQEDDMCLVCVGRQIETVA